MLEAKIEYERTKCLIAFNVQGAVKQRKLNQYVTRYKFSDGSRLDISVNQNYAKLYHMTGICIASRMLFT